MTDISADLSAPGAWGLWRPTPRCRALTVVALTLCLLLPATLPAFGESTEPASRLQKLRTEIQALRSELDTDRSRKEDLQSQLRDAELHIGKVSALLKELDKQLEAHRQDLQKLRKEHRHLGADLESQRQRLGREVRAAYTIGQQEYLKILLNQQDPAAVSRTLTYYDYFRRARVQRMQAIHKQLGTLLSVQAAIQEKTQKLQHYRDEQTVEKASLVDSRQNRQQVLAGLDLQIRSKGERLEALLADQKQLQQLLQELAEEAVAREGEQANLQAFSQMRGKLPWPTQGRISARFGSKRQEGSLKWQGVLIDSREGNEVQAISHGRVAFSDWLRGFGLLTIIDHGDGYMSLYGGNQSLYKEVGDWVNAGEVIASVGNSGGRQRHALYFEIRHNGKPTNPLKWCENQPKSLAKRS